MAGMKTIERVVDHLWERRAEYRGEEPRDFDFPDYGSLPKSISYKMSPEFVDAIQHYVGRMDRYKRKRDFRSGLIQGLRDLGERIR
jgi:hypothetical protein